MAASVALFARRAAAAARPRGWQRALRMCSTEPAPDVIVAKDSQLREQHYALPKTVPEHAFDGDAEISVDDLFRKRLIYRAKQRGWLEVDLILGSWANEEVPRLGEAELMQFHDILKLETVDVYNFLTGRDAVPEALNTPVMQSIMRYAKSAPVGHASPEGYMKVKAGMSN